MNWRIHPITNSLAREPPRRWKKNPAAKIANERQNRGNAIGVAEAIGGVLVAAGVLRDPLLAGASA